MNIRATLGILTYNSDATLARCLESAKGFADIVIADGGSTDDTRAIAERYGARVIAQSAQGIPITDFSAERNLLLAAATEPWFFYLDADEVMSENLVAELERITNDATLREQAFRVRYLKTKADFSVIYRTFKDYYQVRLVRTDIGARFARPVHERLVLPSGTTIGRIEAPWYVPLETDDLSFKVFSPKAWKRIGVQATAWRPKTFGEIVVRIVSPIVEIFKSLLKIILVPLRWGRNGIPTKYELLRVVYSFYVLVRHIKRLFSLLVSKQKDRG